MLDAASLRTPSPTSTEAREPLDFRPRTRVVFGAGVIARLGELARECGGARVLVVTDPGILRAGHVEKALASLAGAGLEAAVFGGVGENPTTRHVAEAAAAAREAKADLLVGLGGGSSIDCAKGANFILTNGGRMSDYWGVGKATRPMLPMIAVPTTAGTGSETQSFALISDEATHVKMACGDPKAACRVALLDPELTVSQPREVAAIAGIDAISHAVESHVCLRRNAVSGMLSREAWRLLSTHFARIFEAPDDLEARGAMLLGASLAGLAIENSMLGAAHACANPLTARRGVTHGKAVALFLPHVIRANAEAAEALYAELVRELEDTAEGRELLPSTRNGPATSLASAIEALRRAAGLPERLRDCGAEEGDLAAMAHEATRQWTGQFNPRALHEEDYLDLYRRAF